MKFVRDDLVWLAATLCKLVWLNLHVGPKIKPHVHTVKFYQNWLKFVGDDSIWLAATMCKVIWLDLYVDSTSRAGPTNKTHVHIIKFDLDLFEMA